MKIRILSDLHFEFHMDAGACFTKSQSDSEYDVLVLAGDITTHSGLKSTFQNFRSAAGSRPIVYVPGNHEFYACDKDTVQKTLHEVAQGDKNLHILDNDSVLIDEQRFVGSTLWFPRKSTFEPNDNRMNDFSLIHGFRNWVGDQARDSASYLSRTVQDGDVVVTHHLPHPRSIHPSYADSPINKYFLHDVSRLVEDGGAKLWVHGHTHMSMDYVAGKTRVVCNPFGYLRNEENSKFQEHLTIEV